MAKGDGDWLPGALVLEARLAGKRAAARREVYRAEEGRTGLSSQTLRRMVAAARRVRAVAKSVGMEVAEVRAAVVSVEALTRLEKRDPGAAAAMRASVLAGETTSRALLSVLRGERLARPAAAAPDWLPFALAIADHLHPGAMDEIAAARQPAGLSAIAREIGVDLELRRGGGATAVFLSPSCAHSEFAGRNLSEQIPRAFMALAFFEGVTFCFQRPEEGREMSRLVDAAGEGAERLRLLDLAAVFP